MKRLTTCAAIALLLAYAARSAVAVTVPFVIDPNASSLSISTTIDPVFGVLPVTVGPQGPGAFTATYTGMVLADVGPTTIQFLPSTSLIAGISGNWQPGIDYSNYNPPSNPGTYPTDFAPANYGSLTDLTALNGTTSRNAIRDLKISLSDAAPKALTAGAFEEAGTLTDFTAGTIFYSSGASPPITNMDTTLFPGPLGNAGTGTLSGTGYGAVLTIPVSFSVVYDISVLHITTTYTGTIVATAIAEPATGTLLLIATVLVAPRRRRN